MFRSASNIKNSNVDGPANIIFATEGTEKRLKFYFVGFKLSVVIFF